MKRNAIAWRKIALLAFTLLSTAANATELSFPFTNAELCGLKSAPSHPKDIAKLHSLCSVWYPGNPIAPLKPLKAFGNTPWHEACSIITERRHGATAEDLRLLRKHISRTETNSRRRNALCYFSLVDLDNDGLRDFRIGSSGRFIENDTDVDNDGVINILDPNPLRDLNQAPDVLPRWLSFRCGINQKMCELQRRIFKKYGVAMINKDFDETHRIFRDSVRSVADNIELIYGKGIRNHPNYDATKNRLPSLRTVMFEHCDTLELSPWNAQRNCAGSLYEVEASAATHNQSFTVYNYSAVKPGFVRLGILAHEFAHSWSFAYDHHTPAALVPILTENYWKVPEFEEELEAFGWTLQRRPQNEIVRAMNKSGLIVSADVEIIEHDENAYLLDGLPLEVLRDLADALNLNSKTARKYGLIGTYALASPWEWQADTVLAWLFRRMERQFLKHTTNRKIAGQLRTLFRAHVFEQWQGLFYHPNLRKRVFNRINRQLAMDEDTADKLVCRYVINGDHTGSRHEQSGHPLKASQCC